ncbi:hypothetical protein [Mesorhizobium sp. INR15]|nr:hypothetical protein [Mesorhizobium sp. INR15]
MAFVLGLSAALLVVFVVMFAITAARDLNSSPSFHRLLAWLKRRD